MAGSQTRESDPMREVLEVTLAHVFQDTRSWLLDCEVMEGTVETFSELCCKLLQPPCISSSLVVETGANGGNVETVYDKSLIAGFNHGLRFLSNEGQNFVYTKGWSEGGPNMT